MVAVVFFCLLLSYIRLVSLVSPLYNYILIRDYAYGTNKAYKQTLDVLSLERSLYTTGGHGLTCSLYARRFKS